MSLLFLSLSLLSHSHSVALTRTLAVRRLVHTDLPTIPNLLRVIMNRDDETTASTTIYTSDDEDDDRQTGFRGRAATAPASVGGRGSSDRVGMHAHLDFNPRDLLRERDMDYLASESTQ